MDPEHCSQTKKHDLYLTTKPCSATSSFAESPPQIRVQNVYFSSGTGFGVADPLIFFLDPDPWIRNTDLQILRKKYVVN